MSVQTTKTQKTKVLQNNDHNSTTVEELLILDKTNVFGQITMKDIPVDVYEVSIEETNDYRSEIKVVDTTGPLTEIVELKKQTHTFLQVEAIEEPANENDYPAPVYEGKVEIIPSKGGKLVPLKEVPAGSGKYEIVVEPGTYVVSVKKIGYIVTQQNVQTKAGICQLQMRVTKALNEEDGYDPILESIQKKTSMKPPDDLNVKKPKFLNPPFQNDKAEGCLQISLAVFQFIDIVSKNAVVNVYIRVVDEGNNKIYSYRSNENGICRVMLKNKISRGRIIIEHEDYYNNTEQLTETRQLLTSDINRFYIIRKPLKGQISFLFLNKAKQQQLNFYVQKESGEVVRKDQDISQFSNLQDGIQLITFDNLLERKGSYLIFACLPNLQHSLEQGFVLLPQQMKPIAIPAIKEGPSQLPLIWVVGNILDPYEQFDSINQVIQAQQFSQFPRFTRDCPSPVVLATLNAPLNLITGHQNFSATWWSLDNYQIEQTVNEVVLGLLQQILPYDDENIIFLDLANVNWIRRDDNSQWTVFTRFPTTHPARCISKVGIDGLAIGSSDGYISFYTVKIDTLTVQLVKESEIREKEPPQQTDVEEQVDWNGPSVMRALQIANDQLVFLSDQLTFWKVEKSLEKPLSATLIKPIAIPEHEVSDSPLLTLVSLDFRVIAYGGANGIVNTIKADTLEKGPAFRWSHDSQVTSLWLNGEQGLFSQCKSDFAWTYVETLQDMKDDKTTLVKKVVPPFPLYGGDVLYYEGRIITFSKRGQLLLYSSQTEEDSTEPKGLGDFLDASEYPGGLKPANNDITYVACLSDHPKENIQIYLVNNLGESISDTTGGVKFFTAPGQQYLEFSRQSLMGLVKVCVRMLNTEKLKAQPPKLYYINYNGFQQLNMPGSIPQSKKQIYHWQMGTLVPPYQVLSPSAYFSDVSLTKYASLELTTHTGKVNSLIQLNAKEFMTAGEDRSIILWDQKTFEIKKVLRDAHNSEIVSLYKVSETLVASGCKTGEIRIWRRVDSVGNYLMVRQIHYHEKSVLSITTIENNATLVSASDDRRIFLVNVASGQQEISETVDRTYVISLSRLPKDKEGFAGGFPDGRIKLWKKEKSGQKILLKTMRTMITVKVQSLTMITTNLMVVCGQEKVAEIWNVETQAKLKLFKDGHQSVILTACAHSKKYVLTSGTDGRISLWNADAGTLIKSFETGNDEIRQLSISEGAVITAGSTGALRVWQDIVPFIEQLVQQDIELQRQKELEEAAQKA